MRRRILMCLILLSGAAPAQIITGGGGGGGGSVGPPGPSGEVTSPAGTYAVDGLVLFNATNGDSIKASTGTGFPFLSSGVVSTVGTTGTGAVVLSIGPTLTGTTNIASATGTAAGVIDFSGSGFLRIPTFTTGAPPTDCDEATEVGRIRLRSQDSATANGGARICQQLVGATYGWMPLGYKSAATAPATCAVGDMYVNTTVSSPPGQQLYLCTSTNNWSLAGDGGAGGGGGGGSNLASAIVASGTSVTVTHNAALANPYGINAACTDEDNGQAVAFQSLSGVTANAATFNFAATVTNVRCTVVTGGSATSNLAKYTVTLSGANWLVNGSGAVARDADGSQAITLFTVPANSVVTGIRIKHSAIFAAPSLSGITVSLGWSAGATDYAPDFNLFQIANATTKWDDGGFFAPTTASHAMLATINSTGANLSALTAGAFDVWVEYKILP